jgi:hypothetical protein
MRRECAVAPSICPVPVQLNHQATAVAMAKLLGDDVRFELEHVERVPPEVMAVAR